jgi:hypothetical protein
VSPDDITQTTGGHDHKKIGDSRTFVTFLVWRPEATLDKQIGLVPLRAKCQLGVTVGQCRPIVLVKWKGVRRRVAHRSFNISKCIRFKNVITKAASFAIDQQLLTIAPVVGLTSPFNPIYYISIRHGDNKYVIDTTTVVNGQGQLATR